MATTTGIYENLPLKPLTNGDDKENLHVEGQKVKSSQYPVEGKPKKRKSTPELQKIIPQNNMIKNNPKTSKSVTEMLFGHSKHSSENKLASEKMQASEKLLENTEGEKLRGENFRGEKFQSEKIPSEKISSEKIPSGKIPSEKISSEKISSEKISSEKVQSNGNKQPNEINDNNENARKDGKGESTSNKTVREQDDDEKTNNSQQTNQHSTPTSTFDDGYESCNSTPHGSGEFFLSNIDFFQSIPRNEIFVQTYNSRHVYQIYR